MVKVLRDAQNHFVRIRHSLVSDYLKTCLQMLLLHCDDIWRNNRNARVLGQSLGQREVRTPIHVVDTAKNRRGNVSP